MAESRARKSLAKAVKDLSARTSGVERELNELRTRTTTLEDRADRSEQRFGALENVVATHGQKLAAHEVTLTSHEQTFEDVYGRLYTLQTKFQLGMAGWATSHGVGGGLKFGLSLPGGEDRRIDLGVAIGMSPNKGLGWLATARYRTDGEGLFVGGNATVIQANKSFARSRNGFLGAGPSLGWTGEHLTVSLDGFIGASGDIRTAALDGGAVFSVGGQF